MRSLFLVCISLFYVSVFCQTPGSLLQNRKIKVADTIKIDSLSIQKFRFQLKDLKAQTVDSTFYKVNFAKAEIYVDTTQVTKDSLQVTYFRYPQFLTQKYRGLNPNLIIPENTGAKKLYQLNQPNYKNSFALFDGLSTSGSISRGITVGNNQNSVFNSQLDLQISGQLGENVTLKASLQDSNIPIQEGGYSQSLDEFDQVFIELTAKKWSIRAGDITVQNNESVFANFTKKLQGLSINTTFNTEKSQVNAYASGALVRGVYNRSNIQGQEGNQGPYKLIGQNGELFVLIISGSERVYINGILLKRGENNDYVIDYNAGEIRFNPTYPITANMRIIVEYQTSQQNYARIFGFGGGKFTSEKLQIEGFIYSENDLKNQTLQQDLSNPQKQILADAGDNTALMTAPSAIEDTFDEGKILYENIGTTNDPIYEFSNDPEATLFQVRFTEVGQGNGNYRLADASVANRIFEYIEPINGQPQANFEPIIQLQAPVKLQVGVVMGSYRPSKKTNINFELAASDNDLNLFSEEDDKNNKGAATKLNVQQRLFGKDTIGWNANVFGNLNWVQKNFRSIERLYNIEFNRDWNLQNNIGEQLFTTTGIQFSNPKTGIINYALEHLNLEDQFTGNRHLLNAEINHKNWFLTHNSSLLNSSATTFDSDFLRSYTTLIYTRDKFWSGGKWHLEDNQEKDKITGEFSNQSQKFQSYEVFTGVGDSTKVFTKVGYRYRENDSIRNNLLQRVTKSNTVYLDSKLIDSRNSRLSFFVNYRVLDDIRETEKDKNLNSRILYRQKFWKNKIQWNTAIETQSGTLPQQEFTYVKVDPGRGLYTWNDYNNDGIQDLQEFELSPFPDQANYIRVLLPRQRFIKTYQNKLSQQLTFNFDSWQQSENKWQRFISHFYNQASYTLDRRVLRKGNEINLNIFDETDDDLGLNLNIRNSIFFNRGKQRYTTNYTFLKTAANNVLVTGRQAFSTNSHRLNFTHKIKESWLFDANFINRSNKSTVENTPNRNFIIQDNGITPKVSYLISEQSSLGLAFTGSKRENTIGENETLTQQKLTAFFRFGNQQNATIAGNFDWFENEFEGNAFSPVAFQILEGLQPGTNFTWSLLAQKKITKFLELNLDYSGRKTRISKTIHTGSVQLRAFF